MSALVMLQCVSQRANPSRNLGRGGLQTESASIQAYIGMCVLFPGEKGKKKKCIGLLNTPNYHNYHNSTSFGKKKKKSNDPSCGSVCP